MQKPICCSLIFIAVAALCVRVAADDRSWTMPKLNPFSGTAAAPTSSAGQPPTSGWKMPKLWSQSPAQSKKRTTRTANQPTTWNRMTNGTQNLMSKTADALNPWDKKQPAPPPKVTGSNSIFTNKSSTKPAKRDESVKPASWWSSDKKDAPKTVNGFLSQPRPQ
jgi:hypothetical protein